VAYDHLHRRRLLSRSDRGPARFHHGSGCCNNGTVPASGPFLDPTLVGKVQREKEEEAMKSVIPVVLIGAGAAGLLFLRAKGRKVQAPEVSEVVEPAPEEPVTELVTPDVTAGADLAVVTAPLAAVELAGDTALVAKTAQAAAEKAARKAAKTAAKAGVKVAVTTGAKAIPVVGWGLAAADAAARGWDGESYSADNIVDSFKQDFDDLTTYGQMLMDDPVETLQITADAFGEMGDSVVKAGQDAVDTVATSASKVMETAASGVVDVASSAASTLQDLVDDPVEILQRTADAFGEMGDSVVKAGQTAVDTVVTSASDVMKTAASGVVDVASSAASALQDLVHVEVPKIDLKLPKIKKPKLKLW